MKKNKVLWKEMLNWKEFRNIKYEKKRNQNKGCLKLRTFPRKNK